MEEEEERGEATRDDRVRVCCLAGVTTIVAETVGIGTGELRREGMRSPLEGDEGNVAEEEEDDEEEDGGGEVMDFDGDLWWRPPLPLESDDEGTDFGETASERTLLTAAALVGVGLCAEAK